MRTRRGSGRLTQLFERLRDCHGLRVDEGEEEDVGSLLLVGKEAGLPVSRALEPALRS